MPKNDEKLSDDMRWFDGILLQNEILLYLMMYILFLGNKCMQNNLEKVSKWHVCTVVCRKKMIVAYLMSG